MIDFKPKLSWRPDQQIKQNFASKLSEVASFKDNYVKLAANASTVPDPNKIIDGVLDMRKWCPPVPLQTNNDCVANSSTDAVEFLSIRDGKSYEKLSRFFLYYNSRLQHGEETIDEGTYIRMAFSTFTTLGTCSEKIWPYDQSKVFTRPSWNAYRDAYPNKTTNYYRLSGYDNQDRVEAIKTATIAKHPVVFGMTVDDNYVRTGSDGIVAMPQSTRPGKGGHAQIIVGFDENNERWLVMNSWGDRWAWAGFAWVPFKYLDESEADDFWCPFMGDESNVTVTVTPP